MSGADQALRLGRFDIDDVSAAPAPLLGAGARAFGGLLGMNALNPSRSARLGLQVKPLDEIEHEIRRPAGEAP